MLHPQDIDRIKSAIASAQSVEDIERLEKALEEGSLESVLDLVPRSSDALTSLWDTTQVQPLLKPEETKRPQAPIPTRKTPRQEIEEEQANRRYLESSHLLETVISDIFPLVHTPAFAHLDQSDWKAVPTHSEGKKKLIVVDCGTALCSRAGMYENNILVRLVITDFLSDRIIGDFDVALPSDCEAVDTRPSSTGIEAPPVDNAVSFAQAREKLLEYISNETILVTYNVFKCAEAIKIRHLRWLTPNELLQVDPVKKRQSEGKFHTRSVLSPAQLMQAFLGEAVHDRMRLMPIRDRMVETSLGLVRLVKGVARRKPAAIPTPIDPPRRINTIFVTHIPSNWSEEELRVILPAAVEVEPIDFFLQVTHNEWRGECNVHFRSEADVATAFARLTACTDVFVGWEWKDCGKVNEASIRALGSDFGPVVEVRIQEQYLSTRTVLPGKEESRPFGFLSLARYQDAISMAKDPKQIVKDDVSYHVKISKKPITAFKRVPLGEGEDYIEAFIM